MEEDRISRLHDNLIHHILSFVDTKYAVQTSVLSKRWIDIWKSLSFLTFDRKSFSHENTNKFNEFVDMVLIFHDDTTDIQRLRLNLYKSDNTVVANVNRWCFLAIKHHVQELKVVLSQSHDFKYEIPYHLLNCRSLTKLEIHMWSDSGYANIILPGSMNLPQLKELVLEGLSISNVELFKRQLSSCPVLEVLWLGDCNIDNRRNLTVDSASLKCFQYYLSRYRSPQNCTMPKIIKLCAPNLERFLCRSFLTQDYSLENCSPLSVVYFDMTLKEIEEDDENAETYSNLPSEEKQVYAKRLMQFLGAVYMVKSMRLSPGFLEVFSQAPFIKDCQPPGLCNLKTITLEIWSTRDSLLAIAFLLKISPNITAMFLELQESSIVDVGDDWDAGLSVPGILSQLEYVQVEGAVGCDAELKLLNFLLKNAEDLEEISIYFRSGASSLDRVTAVEQFKDKLRVVSGASSSVELVFH